jgi:hypothetical protein
MRLIPALAALILSGCASINAGFDSCARLDCEKMALVDRQAQLNGLTVVWVHPPEKTTRSP